jgi:hypothetical protein
MYVSSSIRERTSFEQEIGYLARETMESQDQRWKETRRSPRVRVEVNARQGIPELAMQKSDALGQQLPPAHQQ